MLWFGGCWSTKACHRGGDRRMALRAPLDSQPSQICEPQVSKKKKKTRGRTAWADRGRPVALAHALRGLCAFFFFLRQHLTQTHR